MPYAIAFKNMETGRLSHYTGKAGDGWLSPNRSDAFFGYSEEGAMRKAKALAEPRTRGLLADHIPLVIASPTIVESEGGHCD